VKAEPNEIPNAPVWARDDAFPEALTPWGWLDAKGKPHPCDSLDALTSVIRDDPDGQVSLVWTPENPRMVLPEELPGMIAALRTARERWSLDDTEDASHKIRLFGTVCAGFVAYSFYRGFAYAGHLADRSGISIELGHQLKFALRATLSSTESGLALLVFVIFAYIPWHQAKNRRRVLAKLNEESMAASVPSLRLDTWLDQQKAPVTRGILVLISLVALAQFYAQLKISGWNPLNVILHSWGGIDAAGLEKTEYDQGDWWRLFTAPLLHGNIVHFLMNASALAYLGKRLETFARWPHLSMVFLFSACVGGEASARFIATTTVGASGGLMGWLGFLLVFETLHGALIPLRARRRLAAGVLLTALIGLVGYRYIDNAAHAGGLIAGMLYAVIVFPKSSSAVRPRANITDQVAGGIFLAALIAAAVVAIHQILAV
jgi:membrane associated rhomboid family serine protease